MAIKSNLSASRRPGTRWLTVEWSDDDGDLLPPFPSPETPLAASSPSDPTMPLHEPHPSYIQSLPPLPLSPPQAEFYRLPKAPELCQALSDFEQGHSDLRVYVKAIFNVTKKLVNAKQRIVNVQEYWMEVGMNEMAHDLIPLLDYAEETMPRYTFPPVLPKSVDPIM